MGEQSAHRVSLYPLMEADDSGWLEVEEGVEIYYEVAGNPHGIPVVVCHGGPGGFSKPKQRQIFDPSSYQIITFDQRGGGRTKTAFGASNTTTDLLRDMEKLRRHLGGRKWCVAGGSWGSTLALLYAQKYPQNVLAVLVWAVFLADAPGLDWLFDKRGAARMLPQQYADFIEFFKEKDPKHMLQVCQQKLSEGGLEAQFAAAEALLKWEAAGMDLAYKEPEPEEPLEDEAKAAIVNGSKLWLSYAQHGFYVSPNQIINEAQQLAGITGAVVHGRYDLCCPLRHAWQLHKAWPDSQLKIVNNAAHSRDELWPELVKITNRFAANSSFGGGR